MKPFEIPSFFIDPWDDLTDVISVSQTDPTGSASDYTTPEDVFDN